DADRLPELAADLVRRRVTLIAAPFSMPAALAAKSATTTIPIVFSAAGDPVQTGLVANLNRPGGNVTGITDFGVALAAKRLELLHELLPSAARFAVLVNPGVSPSIELLIREVQAAATVVGRQVEVLTAGNSHEIDAAFASLLQRRADALMVSPQALFLSRRAQILTQTARHAVPAVYPDREFVEAGGLMSYGSNTFDRERQAGLYAGRVLKGEKPSALANLGANKLGVGTHPPTGEGAGPRHSGDVPPPRGGGDQRMGGEVKNKPPPPKFSPSGSVRGRAACRVAYRL